MASVEEYKCLSCKAGLEFDPPSQHWKCKYCFSEYTKEQLDAAYGSKTEAPDEEQPELDSYRCTSCGAELLADETTSATFCLYCKNPTVIKTRFAGRFKPKNLIPFRLTQQQAKELYTKWIKKRLFAPDSFKNKEEIDKITGIYAPFWLFDCKAQGMINGEGTTVSSWTVGDYRYTQTKYYRVFRAGQTEYERIPVDGSKKLDDTLMQKIEPYNYADLTDFSMQYMSGFMAERYDVDSDAAHAIMQRRAEQYLEQSLKATATGYASYSVKERQVNLSDTVANYSMLPIYLLMNKFKGKEHAFVVNGQTGKVVGQTPISHVKQLLFGCALFAGVWVLAVFGGAFFA